MSSFSDEVDASDLDDMQRGAEQKQARKDFVLEHLAKFDKRHVVWYVFETLLQGYGFTRE